ncbi:hypothetical protein BDR06DRAFT_968184 [Suillus hirtellus]|nr:hypothetical protein BDR06DRAFT_968184 [Suillus hirtellus]
MACNSSCPISMFDVPAFSHPMSSFMGSCGRARFHQIFLRDSNEIGMFIFTNCIIRFLSALPSLAVHQTLKQPGMKMLHSNGSDACCIVLSVQAESIDDVVDEKQHLSGVHRSVPTLIKHNNDSIFTLKHMATRIVVESSMLKIGINVHTFTLLLPYTDESQSCPITQCLACCLLVGDPAYACHGIGWILKGYILTWGQELKSPFEVPNSHAVRAYFLAYDVRIVRRHVVYNNETLGDNNRSAPVPAFYQVDGAPQPIPILTYHTEILYPVPLFILISPQEEIAFSTGCVHTPLQVFTTTSLCVTPSIPSCAPTPKFTKSVSFLANQNDEPDKMSMYSSILSLDLNESKIPKPEGEAGHLGHGGYNLEKALNWDSNRFKKFKEYVYRLINNHCDTSKSKTNQTPTVLNTIERENYMTIWGVGQWEI